MKNTIFMCLLTAAGAFETNAQDLPLGLTCGVAYKDMSCFIDCDISQQSQIREVNACNDVATLTYQNFHFCPASPPWCTGCSCVGSCACQPDGLCGCVEAEIVRQSAPNFTNVFDGDFGNWRTAGYYHQELSSGGVTYPADSTHFVLARGAVCGFHHTRNSNPPSTCMGYDPAVGAVDAHGQPLRLDWPSSGMPGCPEGWRPRKAFDMSSDYGYWVWCEYLDPNNLSDGSPTVAASGVACGISHNDRSDWHYQGGVVGQCMGYTTFSVGYPANCPGMTGSPEWLDSGEDDRTGLGFCTTGSTLPPPYQPPVCDVCTPADCGVCPPNTHCDGLKGDGCGSCFCSE